MKRVVLLLLLVACSPVACSPSGAAPLPQVPRPVIFAHRGGAGEGPESTVPTIEATLARYPGVGIELDVRRSRDGQVVVIHDATVDRTTNGTGPVAELTLAQLQALDAGHCATPGQGNGTARRDSCRTGAPTLFPFRGRGYRIPTLQQALAVIPAGTPLGIEVKAPGYEDEVARLVRASPHLPRLIVGSADSAVSERLQALLPQAAHYLPRAAATRLVLAAKLTFGLTAAPRYQVLAVPTEAGGMDVGTRGVVTTAQARGVMVLYWTIDDAAEMRRLLDLGADGLITNYPGRAFAIRR